MEEFEDESQLLQFVEDSRTDTLAVLGMFRKPAEHQKYIDVFTHAEHTFRSYGHEDVTFGRTTRLSEKNKKPKVFITTPHYADSDHITSMVESLEFNVTNVVRFAFFTLIPPYAKWPEFPSNRGTVDEVQRANLHAKNDLPKVYVYMLKEGAEDYGVRIHQALDKVGTTITGFMVIIHVVVPSKDHKLYLQTAVREGEEEQYMDALASGRLVIIGYDPVSGIRDAEARFIDTFTADSLLGFCNGFLKMLPEDAQNGRSPFPIKYFDKRGKNTIGLGKYTKKEL